MGKLTDVCKICGKSIYNDNKSKLCRTCYIERYNQEKITKWKQTGDTGCKISTTLRNCIRDYIYTKQNNRCSICGMERIWNEKPIKFILDHIDGNASNNKEENLRLICPNCDSQLDTFKSKNKNSARTHRKNIREDCQNGNGTDLNPM